MIWFTKTKIETMLHIKDASNYVLRSVMCTLQQSTMQSWNMWQWSTPNSWMGRIHIIIYDMVEAIFSYFIHQILVDSY